MMESTEQTKVYLSHMVEWLLEGIDEMQWRPEYKFSDAAVF